MAPSVWYYNRSAPFWDFVASMEQEGTNHPLFGANNQNNNNENNENVTNNNEEERGEGSSSEAPNPFAGHPFGGPWGGWGRWGHGRGGSPHGRRGGHHHGPPPPGPPPEDGEEGELNEKRMTDGSDNENPEGPGEHSRRGRHGGPHGHRGPHAQRHGGPHGGPHGQHHGGPRAWGRGGRGRCGGRGGFEGFGGPRGPFGLGALAELFQSQMTPGNDRNRSGANDSDDFEPEADVFDTESSFIIHVSLAGAKKEDVGVSWDAEKSELSISGVVHRPGDEDFLKTLSLDERRIGAFLRKIRLGSRANPAQIDVDGITAKLEEGVLTVTVPKEDKDWTEVKKVDVE